MKQCRAWVRFPFSLFLVATVFAWSQEIHQSEELREVLFSTPVGDITLSVNYYEGGIVDVAVNNANGETLYFHSERTSNKCTVSSEDFIIGNASGTMVLTTTCSGANYESWVFFIEHSGLSVHHSLTPTDCHEMGGPGSHYPSLLDVDGDGNYDHVSHPSYLFFLSDECHALQEQLWLEFCLIPSIDSTAELSLEDNTLAVLVNPESQSIRDSWVESMFFWLDESAELSQSHPSILEARGKVWAFKEALVSNNYALVSELYSEL